MKRPAASVLGMSDRELVEKLIPGDRKAEANASALRTVDSLIALANVTGETRYADRALLILRAVCGPFLEASDEELSFRITEHGALDESNLLMRDVSYDLSRIYHLSGDERAAHRAAVILARLAEVMPKWPLVTREGELKDQDDEAYRLAWDANGLWGVWFVSDIEAGLPVVRAFDLIYDSGAMQQLGALEKIEHDLIRYIPEHYLERPMSLGNLTHYMLRSLPLYGMAILEPKYVHIAVQRYRYIINAMYYADGFWHEGSPSYHKDITWGLTDQMPASHLKVGEVDLTGPGYYEGEIIATYRMEAGADFDAFETSSRLPAGLQGRYLMVELGGTLTQAFLIDRVEPTDTGAMIYSKDEPGMEIRGDLIKMMYYPGWGIPGPCRFHISDTLLWVGEEIKKWRR